MKPFTYLLIVLTCCTMLTNCSSTDEGLSQNLIELDENAILNLDITADELFFGDVVQDIEVSKKMTITNQGNSTLAITSISTPNGFMVNWSEESIAAGASKEIIVTFKPNSLEEYSGDVEIKSNSDEGIYRISCSGKGISHIYEGNISFQTDAQIEAFVNRGFSAVEGELCVGLCFDRKPFNSKDITTLAPLSSITSVGTLKISHCKELKNLDGIQDIDISKQLSINNCSLITNVDELNTKISIPSVNIFSNESLQNIDGLQNLESTLSISILNNVQLKNIDGLLKLEELSFLRIFGNTLLENINGLANIKRVERELSIGGSIQITNLNPLENTEQIGDRIAINDLPMITNLKGLGNVVNFDGILSVSRNRLLNNYCDIQAMFQSARLKFFELNRYNPTNNDLCEKDVPLNVYDKSIVIKGQDELDYFLSRAYEIVEGDFILQPGVISSESSYSSGINSLANLKLKSIAGNLELNELDISSLEGLNDLESVSGDLIITNNEDLKDFCAIARLVETNNGFTEYIVSGNLSNPTQEDLMQGNCN